MRYGSVCSGIEAATVAWHPLGWEPAWFSEIDNFPSLVIAHHYPNVPNLGDMTKIRHRKEFNDATIDVLVGGTPCQSFSLAGLRKGLDDPRGNLALEFLALAAIARPRWIVWENVPGVLSSNGGRDFGSFLGALGKLGYGWAYRTINSEYFGVPQRRRRVFVVGYIGGDWQRAAAVLFERHCLQGNPPPGREEGTVVAALTATGVGTCGADDNQGQAGHLIAAHTTGAGFWQEGFGTLRARGQESHEHLIAHTLRGEGFDASEDGTGRGTPLVPVAYRTSGNCGAWETGDRTDAITTGTDPNSHILTNNVGVRRITPLEAERLQGFPDHYTAIPVGRNGRTAKDSPRYKAIGNSMAVPVMRWIGERMQMVEDMLESPH
jgi:DNA (cytosine-5)-methyltransferase 1